MAESAAPSLWEVLDRACNTGPMMAVKEFDMKIFGVASRLVKEYDIKYDPETPVPADDGLGELDGPFGVRGGIHHVEAWKVAWLNLRGRIACGIHHLKECLIEAEQYSHRIESHPIGVQGDLEHDDVPNLGVRDSCGTEAHGGAALLRRCCQDGRDEQQKQDDPAYHSRSEANRKTLK